MQGLRQDVDAAEATTAAAAVEHAAALGSLAAMHGARLDAVRQQTEAQLAALLDVFASCVSSTLPVPVSSTWIRMYCCDCTADWVQSVKPVTPHQADPCFQTPACDRPGEYAS